LTVDCSTAFQEINGHEENKRSAQENHPFDDRNRNRYRYCLYLPRTLCDGAIINACISTAVIGILTFILSILPGRPNYYLATVGILGKLYANSIMAVFNSRMTTGDETTVHHSASDHTSVTRAPRPPNAYEMGVSITREQVSFPPTSGWVKVCSRFFCSIVIF